MENQEKFDQWLQVFKLWCPFLDIKVAAFFAAQSALETGWFKSDVYHQCNNLFGMRMPKSRITLAEGSKLNHAFYNVVYDSFVDYLLWLTAFGFNQSDLKDFSRFVAKFSKSPYNSSNKYVATILEIYNIYYHE